MMQAERGMQELLESVDTLIVIPNEKLLAVAKDAGFFESFRIADDVLRQGVQGISDIITITGIINRDFADVKTTMAGMGYAVMGTASRGGGNRAVDAAMAAMASPLLEAGAIDGARGILINITGSSNLKLSEVNEASTIIQNAAHEDCNIIFGAVMDERMGDEVKITVIATGFKQDMPERRARMLAEATLPTAGYEVPIRQTSGRGFGARETPRFASEVREAYTEVARQTPADEAIGEDAAREAAAAVEAEIGSAGDAAHEVPADDADWTDEMAAFVGGRAEAVEDKMESVREPELVPVAASVFDDDFFRRDRGRVAVEAARAARESSAEMLERDEAEARAAGAFTFGGYMPAAREYGAPEPARETMLFAGASGSHGGHAETDELDIPAFLRRSR